MPQVIIMTQKENAEISLKAFELKKQGKLDEYERTKRQIPLPPYMTKFIKEHIEYFGENFFDKYGWNLGEPEVKYELD